MYVLAWRSLLTNATGRGAAAFEREELEEYVKDLNKRYAGEMTHWLEPAA